MFGYEGVETGLAPTPIGPNGKRASMFNGLADSIWVGSENKAGAAKWVEFLGSPDCQDIVGEAGVVFPAIPSGDREGRGGVQGQGRRRDDLPGPRRGQDDLPVPDHRLRVADRRHHDAGDGRRRDGKADPSSLTEANNQVNALFG